MYPKPGPAPRSSRNPESEGKQRSRCTEMFGTAAESRKTSCAPLPNGETPSPASPPLGSALSATIRS